MDAAERQRLAAIGPPRARQESAPRSARKATPSNTPEPLPLPGLGAHLHAPAVQRQVLQHQRPQGLRVAPGRRHRQIGRRLPALQPGRVLRQIKVQHVGQAIAPPLDPQGIGIVQQMVGIVRARQGQVAQLQRRAIRRER
jgi:hypothetical protein